MVKKINFKNKIFSKKDLKEIIYESFTKYGISRTYLLADDLKVLGFSYATKAGISRAALQNHFQHKT
jgi:DNA-directed RNA polymerase subunit beta'